MSARATSVMPGRWGSTADVSVRSCGGCSRRRPSRRARHTGGGTRLPDESAHRRDRGRAGRRARRRSDGFCSLRYAGGEVDHRARIVVGDRDQIAPGRDPRRTELDSVAAASIGARPCGRAGSKPRIATLPTLLPGGRPFGITSARPTSARAARRAKCGMHAASSGVRPSSTSSGTSAQPSGTNTRYLTATDARRRRVGTRQSKDSRRVAFRHALRHAVHGPRHQWKIRRQRNRATLPAQDVAEERTTATSETRPADGEREAPTPTKASRRAGDRDRAARRPGWSLGRTLMANTTDPLSVRVVEWARDHRLGGVVGAIERAWYAHHQPPSGGTPKNGIPRAPGPTAAPHRVRDLRARCARRRAGEHRPLGRPPLGR